MQQLSEMRTTYKTADLCAGIGGIRRGFEMTGRFENVLSAEIDKSACRTYEHLFGENPLNDIMTDEFIELVKASDYDVIMAGFPCQAFSSVGLEEGFRDKAKGTVFFSYSQGYYVSQTAGNPFGKCRKSGSTPAGKDVLDDHQDS